MSVQRVALVTGAGRGLGRAIALELAGRGLALVVNAARSQDDVVATASAVTGAGGTALTILADVGDADAVRSMFNQVNERFGRLDVLVNNAGVNRDADFREMTDEEWGEVLQTNLTGPFLCSRAAVPLMETAGSGSIVNITARTAYRPRRRGANYCAAKAGLSMLSKCLALELAPTIRVNCVAPGTTDTSEVRTRFDLDTAGGMAKMVGPIALGRIAAPEEIAKLVAFVALDAGFMTGADVLYDGGRNLS